MIQRRYYNLPKPMTPVLWGLCFLILFILLVFLISILPKQLVVVEKPKNRVKVTFADQPPTETRERSRQIIEAPLKETLAPVDPDFLGLKNHQTVKEQKFRQPKMSSEDAVNTKRSQNRSISGEPNRDPARSFALKKPVGEGPKRYFPKKEIDKFLPRLGELIQSASADGHREVVGKDMEEGDILDVNTREYKWIGYFTNVRKMVEQTIYNPHSKFGRSDEVQKRLKMYGSAELSGVASVMLKITRSGLLIESKVIESSGDEMVDKFWLEILNLTAPYPPLPRHYPDDTLTFKYDLQYEFTWKKSVDIGSSIDRARPF